MEDPVTQTQTFEEPIPQTFTMEQLDRAFYHIRFDYQNMTYNTSCDLFPTLNTMNYTTLHTQMVDYCRNNLQEIRLDAMEEVQTRWF